MMVSTDDKEADTKSDAIYTYYEGEAKNFNDKIYSFTMIVEQNGMYYSLNGGETYIAADVITRGIRYVEDFDVETDYEDYKRNDYRTQLLKGPGSHRAFQTLNPYTSTSLILRKQKKGKGNI